MGLSALGAAHIQGEYNQKSADKANKLTEKMQQRDMKFQRDMRATMYQDMVKDLEAAGLNPILAYQKQGIGGSASGGSAQAASISQPDLSTDFNPKDIFAAKQMSSDASLKDEMKRTEAKKQAEIDARIKNIKEDTRGKDQKNDRGQPVTDFINSFLNESNTGRKAGEGARTINEKLQEGITDFLDDYNNQGSAKPKPSHSRRQKRQQGRK